MIRYGNPSVRRWAKKSEAGQLAVNLDSATYRGVMGKGVFMLGLTVFAALAMELTIWYALFRGITTENIGSVLVGFLIGLGVAGVLMLVCVIAIAISPTSAKVFGPIYALTQGAFLGLIAAFLNIIIPLVTVAAMLGTALVFVLCVLLYKRLGVRIQSGAMRTVVISLMSFLLVEIIIVPIMLLLHMETMVIIIELIASLFCIFFATLTIIWDLQNIDYMVQAGADKKYEWPVAFSLVTSLIYLYLQILELILRIVSIVAVSKSKK